MSSPENEALNDRVRTLEHLHRQLREHPATQAEKRWNEIRRSWNVFTRNTRELVDLLVAAETNEDLAIELVQNVRPPDAREEYIAQLDQKLHNMLASAVALVDHTRKFAEYYSDTGFKSEYERRNKIIRDDPGARFLRDLRNYLLHVGVAPFAHELSIHHGEEFESQVLLNSEALLEWRKWTSVPRTFIEDSGSTVHLTLVVKEYREKMEEMFGWVFAQFESLHSRDLADARELVRTISTIRDSNSSEAENQED